MFAKRNIRLGVSRLGRQGWLRFRPYCRPLILALCLLAFSRPAFSAPFCATPGNDGAGFPSGVINTYYPGTSSASAGATSISVGPPSPGTPIAAGDLLLVIQMQDADINTSNDSSYGGSSSGSGYTSLNQAGLYEYVIASSFSSSSVTITSGLVNSYRSRAASGTNGQSTFQVIRVPQYSTATVIGEVSALAWNGTVGGVLAMDVAGTLTINGTITANGAGFRGGWGESANTTGPFTDYRTRATILGNGMKGEGIAGSPNRMNQPSDFNGAPNQVTSGTSLGYPDGANTDASKGRGAPGNAGGGGTDGNTANDQNSGGGGGGNFAAGAKGGNSWNSNLPVGGEGGSGVSGLAFNRVVMGGGGGAGTTNNGTADNATYFTPAGLSCTAGAGACSSGAPGGGIILIRSNSLAGGGMVTANGGSGYNVLNDSAGGGGAGGSVVIDSLTGGSLTVSANGGDGGNAWRSQTTLIDRHGPGGAGSGGFVAYSPATGFAVSATVNGGTSGRSCNNDAYGSTSSSGGIYTFQSPNAAGPLPGASCVPKLSTSTKTVVDLDGGDYLAGDLLQYIITLNESNGAAAASGVSVTDTIDTNLAISTVTPPAGANYTIAGNTLNISGINVPANGSVSIVFNATISPSATPGTTIPNTATVTNPNGNGATPVAPVVTVAGSVIGSGNKPLYLYYNPYVLSRTRNTTSTNYVTINTTTSQVWTMNPAAAAPITISPAVNATVPVTLYLRRSGGNSTNGNRNIKVDLQCSSVGTILTQTRTLNLNSSVPVAYNFNLTTTPPPWTTPITCGQGSTWNLMVSETTGSGTDPTRVYPASGGNPSHADLPAMTVINVDSIDFYDDASPLGSAITTVQPGNTVYIRATVSDPFGSYDIHPSGNTPTITIRDSNGNLFYSGAMTRLAATGAEIPASRTKIFEHTCAIPALAATGDWSISVQAFEGTEGTVTHTTYATMPVLALPLLTVLKEVSTDGGANFTTTPLVGVNPGATLTYRITVRNDGAGIAINVVMIDPKPAYTTYSANSGKRATGAIASTYAAAPTTLTDLNAADDGFDYGVTTSGIATYRLGALAPGPANSVQLFFKVTVN